MAILLARDDFGAGGGGPPEQMAGRALPEGRGVWQDIGNGEAGGWEKVIILPASGKATGNYQGGLNNMCAVVSESPRSPNVQVSVDMEYLALSGGVYGTSFVFGGPVCRMTGSGLTANGYAVEGQFDANIDQLIVKIIKVINGNYAATSVLFNAGTMAGAGAPQTRKIGLRAEGTLLSALVDGAVVGSVNDATHQGAGQVGWYQRDNSPGTSGAPHGDTYNCLLFEAIDLTNPQRMMV